MENKFIILIVIVFIIGLFLGSLIYNGYVVKVPKKTLIGDGGGSYNVVTSTTTTTLSIAQLIPYLNPLQPNTVSIQNGSINTTHVLFDIIINDVNFQVSNIPYHLNFNPNILTYVGFKEGDYLAKVKEYGGATVFLVNYKNYDPNTGELFVGASALPPGSCNLSANGENWLMTFYFKRISSTGETPINFTYNSLSNCSAVGYGLEEWHGATFIEGVTPTTTTTLITCQSDSQLCAQQCDSSPLPASKCDTSCGDGFWECCTAQVPGCPIVNCGECLI